MTELLKVILRSLVAGTVLLIGGLLPAMSVAIISWAAGDNTMSTGLVCYFLLWASLGVVAYEDAAYREKSIQENAK